MVFSPIHSLHHLSPDPSTYVVKYNNEIDNLRFSDEGPMSLLLEGESRISFVLGPTLDAQVDSKVNHVYKLSKRVLDCIIQRMCIN